MQLNEAMKYELDINFEESPTVVGINNIPSNIVLDVPESKKRLPVFNALLDRGIFKPGSVVSYIPDFGKPTSSEKITVRDGDDVYYVGISRGSFQFYVITYSEVDFYLFL